jgi:large subunit ribosomal protein L15
MKGTGAPRDTLAAEREMNELSNLQAPKGATHSRKRRGRGIGSRLGKTGGRGHKGAGQRSGSKRPAYFEGGQMPIARRLPKVGFTNIFAKSWAIVNVGDLERFDAGTTVDEAALKEAGLIKGRYDFIKILGDGEVQASLKVVAHKFSKSAESKISAAGGSIETRPLKTQSHRRKGSEVVGG